MAELTVDGLGELTSPAANDEIGIWDVSAGQYLKIRRDTLVGGTITGGGTVATGGYTLTVPATGTAALIGTANVFSANQTINGFLIGGNTAPALYEVAAGHNVLKQRSMTLAASAAYTIPASLTVGFLFVSDSYDGGAALYSFSGANGIVSAIYQGANFQAFNDGAAKIQMYYAAGSYYLHNKTAEQRTFHLLTIY
ncbi:MAG: hypothetical protein KAX65_15885 [Caldilineaceae bacterium]|nr:hypothetical protein [Caldilineaceae bacterium]